MKWILRFVMQRAVSKGSARFAALGIAIAALRFFRKILGAEPHTMYTHELQPGEVLVVREQKQPR